MAICCVSEKIQTAYLRNTLQTLDFFNSLHLTIYERPANFDFFSQLNVITAKSREQTGASFPQSRAMPRYCESPA
jgi:hypothetical protein